MRGFAAERHPLPVLTSQRRTVNPPTLACSHFAIRKRAHPVLKNALRRIIPVIAASCVLTVLSFAQEVSISPKGGPPTTTIKVSGTGFAPNSQVNIFFDLKDEALAVSNSSGSFSNISIPAPASAIAGQHWVSAVQPPGRTGAQSPFFVHTDWSQLGFEPAHTWWNRYENVLTAGNVSRVALAWSKALPSGGAAVAGDSIYVTSVDSLYAVNAITGATRWSYTVSSAVQGTPAVDKNSVFFGANDFNVYAVSAIDGTLLWKFTTGSFVVSSVTVADGIVFAVSDDDNVYALNESDGTLLWKFATQAPVQSSPSVSNGLVYVASSDGNIYALNQSTGIQVWQFLTTAQNNSTTPTVANGIVYVASADENLYALNASNGNLLWKTNLGAPSDGCFAAAAEGMIFLGSGDGGIFYGLDANTGAIRWKFVTRVPVYAASAVANGVVYFGDGNGFFYAVTAASGKLLWRYTTGGFFPSGTVTDGRIVLSSDSLYLFAAEKPPAVEQPRLQSLHP